MTNTFLEDEEILLKSWRNGDVPAFQVLVRRYQNMVYGAVMNLARCRADEAYQFTVQSFVDAANRVLAEHDRSLLVETLRNAYDLGRNQTVPSFFDTSDVDQYPSPKKESLRMVKEAFFSVDYEARAALVLRDQCNLPYEEIASILGLSLKEAKIRVTNARGVLRDKVAEILARMREGT